MKILNEASSDEKKFYKSGITDSKKSAEWAKNYVYQEVTRLHRAPEYKNDALKYYRALKDQWFKAAQETWDSFEDEVANAKPQFFDPFSKH